MRCSTLRLVVGYSLCSLLLGVTPARAGFTTLVTLDATQSLKNPADNAEIVLSDNKTAQVMAPFVNGFATPNAVNVHYDLSSNTTIVKYTGPAISTDPVTRHTFGFAYNGVTSSGGVQSVNPGVVDALWTTGGAVDGHLPAQDISVQYTPTLHMAKITISNDPDSFSLSSVGYLLTNAPFPISSLNRTTLPPGAFTSSGIPDGTQLAPGTSVSFNISGIQSGQYITVFSDAMFSGTSATTNEYKDTSGRWLEFQPTPEPSSWALLVIGAVGLVGWRRRAR